MKVRCINNSLSPDQKIKLGIPLSQDPHYQITIGKTYTVFGVSFHINQQGNGCVYFEIIEDQKPYCISIPICLFNIEDPRLSKYWIAQQKGLSLLLWPKEFLGEYFHDDLSDGAIEIKKLFDQVVNNILMENDT